MATPHDYFSNDSLRKGLKKKTVRGGAFVAVSQALSAVISLVALSILSRLLESADFGVILKAAVFTGFAAMFVDAGMSMATVQREEINRRQVSNLFWFSTAMGLAIALLVSLLSPLVSLFYQDPRLTPVVVILSCAYLFSGMTSQHQAMMKRAMQYDRLTMTAVVSLIIGQGVGVAMAWWLHESEHGYWALAAIPVATAAAKMALSWLVCPWRPDAPKRGVGTREMIVFGADLTGFSTVNYLSRNLDNMLIGWWWGDAALGFYGQAYKLFALPMRLINAPVANVMVPALSRLTSDPQRYRTAYLKVTGATTLLIIPAAAYGLVAAPWLIPAALGPGWEPAVPIFRALLLMGMLQPVANSTGWLFVSQGRSREQLQWGLVGSSLCLLSFLVGLPWGAVGVALAYSLGGLLVRTPLLFWWVGRRGPVSARDLIGTLLRAAPHAAVVALANLPLLMWLDEETAPLVGVAATLGVTAVAYAASLAAIPSSRRLVLELKRVGGELRGGGVAQAAGGGDTGQPDPGPAPLKPQETT
ncbi:lipopolysaccharide biosynthesis protein [Pseudobythopirellula maris]|uniref:lipopolysaccharide biosynthesis protein n=1 Tax=Pseudobythopirellula maris TaxID=2527991 RepID=UPI0018D2B63E|nr:lipopolysaccharide biosynthesis protein [Pseudobythopirellula maris]